MSDIYLAAILVRRYPRSIILSVKGSSVRSVGVGGRRKVPILRELEYVRLIIVDAILIEGDLQLITSLASGSVSNKSNALVAVISLAHPEGCCKISLSCLAYKPSGITCQANRFSLSGVEK